MTNLLDHKRWQPENCKNKEFNIDLDNNIPATLSLPDKKNQDLGLGQGVDYRNAKVKATALEMAGVKIEYSKASDSDQMNKIMISDS